MSPLLSGGFAVIAGNFVGAITDRVSSFIESRLRLVEALKLKDSQASMVDATVGIFFQVGMMSLATNLVTSGAPWITTDASAFTMYLFGLWATSPHLKNHLRILNTVLLDEKIYEEGKKIQKTVISSDATEPVSS